MLWFFFVVFVAVVIAAGTSLVASWDSRRDLASGRPLLISIADQTGIWDRSKLDELIGPCDDEDRYAVSAEAVGRIPRTWWKRWFDRDLADVGCIALSLVAALLIGSHPSLAWVLLGISATQLVVGYVGSAIIVVRNGALPRT